MKSFRTILFFLIFCTPLFISAQKEAYIWPVGDGKQFNFQSGSLEFSDFSGNRATKSVICDKNGNLVLYTDGRTVWNKNNEIVLNGDNLISDDAFQMNKPIFVPYPKKEGWYFLFYEEEYFTITGGRYDNALYYAEINLEANNGKGEVVKKKIKIHDNFHSGPTIAGFCDNSYFWLVNDRNDNTQIEKEIDRIYSYKIDENGVNHTPVISEDLDMGSSGSYRFSPDGDKLFFIYGGNSGPDAISDFNFKTGKLYNYRLLNLNLNWANEFSPDSRLFYYFSGPHLLQLDARYTDIISIFQTIDTIVTLKQSNEVQYSGQDLRLAPDGKIYFQYTDVVDKKNKLGRINQPNSKGTTCDVELNYLTLDSYDFRFPEFVPSFFRDKHPVMIDEVFPNAGADKKICSGSSVTLGLDETANAFYTWTPPSNLSEPFSPHTVFSPPKYYGLPKTDRYIIRATDGNCWVNFDTAFISINPVPYNIPIDGSWSVCPFVEKVDYWTSDSNDSLKWLVDGGEIVTVNTAANVKVNWFDTNSNASVSVFSQNQYKCFSDTSVFPVRINVELITETPKGPEEICIGECKNVNYHIKRTNGSVYQWNAEGGKIIHGNGTNSVDVEWSGEGMHSISVEETSTTTDTICFGESMPLKVEVINDSLEVELIGVSFTPDEILKFEYSSQSFDWKKHELYLTIQSESGNFQSTIDLTGNDKTFFYMPPSTISKPVIFSLKVINSCKETFQSNSQQIIIVEGVENVSTSKIDLTWNKNKFWEGDELEHEIWYLDENVGTWKLLNKIGDDDSYSVPLEGLSHIFYFRIYEYNKTRNVGSWSNKTKVKIEGNLIIPDVLTPNGDGINDTWEIANLRFHQVNRILVFDRYGNKVYECKENYIPWEGKINGEVRQGTYLFQIWFIDGNQINGQLTVLQ